MSRLSELVVAIVSLARVSAVNNANLTSSGSEMLGDKDLTAIMGIPSKLYVWFVENAHKQAVEMVLRYARRDPLLCL